MNEFIQQYLPEITSAIAAFISSGGVLVLVKFMMGKFGELKETVKNDTEIKELRKMVKELTEKQAEINTRCVTLIHQDYELKEAVENETEIKELRKMVKELTEKQAEINKRCVTLIHQNYELNKMMKEEQNAKQNDNRL